MFSGIDENTALLPPGWEERQDADGQTYYVSLPEGWTMQPAPNGRVFFINHNDKKTTCVDPRTGRPSPLPVSPSPPYEQREEELGLYPRVGRKDYILMAAVFSLTTPLARPSGKTPGKFFRVVLCHSTSENE